MIYRFEFCPDYKIKYYEKIYRTRSRTTNQNKCN